MSVLGFWSGLWKRRTHSGTDLAGREVAQAEPNQSDRRSSARYRSPTTTAWLGWSDDRGFIAWPARVEDLAVGGARLGIRKGTPLPHCDTPLKLWIGDSTPASDEARWIDVEVLQETPRAEGGRELRVNFPDGCPYYVFSSAVWGEALAGARA